MYDRIDMQACTCMSIDLMVLCKLSTVRIQYKAYRTPLKSSHMHTSTELIYKLGHHAYMLYATFHNNNYS